MKTKLILEICQNHSGSKNLLKEMVHAAKEANAEYVKIQDIKSEELTYRPMFEKGLTKNGKIEIIKRPFLKEKKRLKQLDMNDDFLDCFIDTCKKYKIKPLVTPFTYKSLDRIKNKKFNLIKIASYDCASIPFLKKTLKLNKKLIISTGGTRKSEIIKTSKVISKKLYAFLHCVTIYPTPLNMCNLLQMNFLKKYSSKIGWSDHTLFESSGHTAAMAAAWIGADLVERHFTIQKKNKTKDGPVSINFKETKELIEFFKLKKNDLFKELNKYNSDWQSTLKIHKKLTHEELLNRNYYRGRFAVKKEGGGYLYNWNKV